MGPWQAIYIAAGVGAIIALTAYLITDALELRRTIFLGQSAQRLAAPRWPRRWSFAAAILLVLWLSAAIAR